jgi:hypothetical protein
MELNFTPRTINEIENQMKQPIEMVVGNSLLSNLNLLIRKGMGINETEADKTIMEFFAEGNDKFKLQLFIMKRLEDQGFLSQEFRMSETIPQKMAEARKKIDALEIFGETARPQL